MGYSTVVAGTTITASWANANVRDQVVTPFATTAARASAITSPLEGMVSVITTEDRLSVYDGTTYVDYGKYGAWDTYTPVLSQGATITKTVTYARYVKLGRMLTVAVDMAVTSAGTAANPVFISAPAFTAVAATGQVIGSGIIDDATVGSYPGLVALASTTSFSLIASDVQTVAASIGQTPSFAFASGDRVRFTCCYETTT